MLNTKDSLHLIECVHDGHVGGPKQYYDFPLGYIFYFHANIFYCFSPPTWPPCTHSIECVHDGHVGGPKQYTDFPWGNRFYFYANIFYCFSPPTWPPCIHSIETSASDNYARRAQYSRLKSPFHVFSSKFLRKAI